MPNTPYQSRKSLLSYKNFDESQKQVANYLQISSARYYINSEKCVICYINNI